jgi:hypothetical protein
MGGPAGGLLWLWAHSGHRHWWPLPSLSVVSQWHYSLSRGLNSPLPYFPARLHSQPITTLFWGYAALITTLQHAQGPRKGGLQSACLNHHTLCAFLGLAHHHTPPQQPSHFTIIHFNLGITETDAPTFYPHSPFPGNCPHHCLPTCSSLRLPNTLFISPPH